MIINNITEMIGNTPLLLISEKVHKIPNLKLYCKLEYMNAFGSIKDRIALNMLKSNLDECIQKNKTILEASSGNTSNALSILASINGLKFKTISNRIKSIEKKELMLFFNADVKELPGVSECPDPNNPEDYMSVAKKLADNNPDEIFYTDQYFNPLNPKAHVQTGIEIINDLENVDYFFTFLGTAGSSTGIGSVLKEKRNSKIIGVVADKGNYIPGGRTLDEMWEVGFFENSFYDKIISGSTSEAIDGMVELGRKSGLMSGPTAGLSYKKVIDYFKENPPEKEVSAVFIACDRIETYLSYLKKYAPQLVGKSKNSQFYDQLSREDISSVEEISVEELKNAINNVTIIDIRSRQSFDIYNLPNSINVPEDEIEEFFEHSIPFSKNRKLVVACPVGVKSRKLASLISKKGYSSASLKGGINAWMNSEAIKKSTS